MSDESSFDDPEWIHVAFDALAAALDPRRRVGMENHSGTEESLVNLHERRLNYLRRLLGDHDTIIRANGHGGLSSLFRVYLWEAFAERAATGRASLQSAKRKEVGFPEQASVGDALGRTFSLCGLDCRCPGIHRAAT